MKRMPILLSLLALGACSSVDDGFDAHPDQYGLYVAVINIYMDIPVQIKSDETGEVISIQSHLFGSRGGVGYLQESLKPGRYHLYSYHPYSNVDLSLLTDTGYFDVQAGCFNYGGEIDFTTIANHTAYTNTVDMDGLRDLPKPIAKEAAGKDVCSAPMGKANQRFPYASIKNLLSD